MTDTDPYAAYTKLRIERPAPKVLRIIMDNGRMNSADHAMHAELARIWQDVDQDPEVNAAILTGAGKVFSAGGDFGMIKDLVNDPEARLRGWKEARDIVYNLINCAKPDRHAPCAAWPSAPAWCAACWPTSRSPPRTA